MAGAGIRALGGSKPLGNKALSAAVAQRAWANTSSIHASFSNFVRGKTAGAGAEGGTAAKLSGAKPRIVLGADRQMTNKDHTADFRGGARGDMSHYSDALEKLRYGTEHNSPAEAMKEIRAIRAQRSIAQNRAGLQQNLFGGAEGARKHVSADVTMSAATRQHFANEAATKDARRVAAARAARKAEIAARPYKAPAENPRTTAAKLSGPGTVNVPFGHGERGDVASHGSIGSLHIVGGGRGADSFGVIGTKSSNLVTGNMSKPVASAFARGAHTGRTIDRLERGTPAQKASAGKAVKRYTNIVQARKDQAVVAKAGFGTEIQTHRYGQQNEKKLYRAAGRDFKTIKEAGEHLAKHGSAEPAMRISRNLAAPMRRGQFGASI